MDRYLQQETSHNILTKNGKKKIPRYRVHDSFYAAFQTNIPSATTNVQTVLIVKNRPAIFWTVTSFGLVDMY
jgi:hypothetical protein